MHTGCALTFFDAHLVRKPLRTFRDAFFIRRASCPKTASHFSGCALSSRQNNPVAAVFLGFI
ncbi:hypothetical protein CWE02_04185 [Brucella pituitosa]|nr:hypothetical protein CWE02_04185 [Brucella pituitosa]